MEVISGHIGDFDVFVFQDVITVSDGKRIVLKHQVKGLSRFLAEHQGRVRITLGRTEDFMILGLYGPDGFGYALNLDDPVLPREARNLCQEKEGCLAQFPWRRERASEA